MARSKSEEGKVSDQVYFDPRRAAQQAAEDEEKISEEEKEKLENVELGAAIVGGIFKFFAAPAILMLVWNVAMPGLGIPTIGYFTAMGLYIICKILFDHE
tara:strand:- start:575 stop:874 length:300 start_codon:yes stop_codon:yes gene_type:complete